MDITFAFSDPTPYPLALSTSTLAQDILALLSTARHHGQLTKGANEVVKQLSRGAALLVVLAADCDPLAITSHLPLMCEEKNVAYIYVESKVALGRACGLTRQVVAAAVKEKEGSELEGMVEDVRGRVERLMI